jgi:hypothetical protein
MYELTPKDRRAIKLMSKLQTDDLETRLKDFHHFLDTLVYINEVLTDEKVAIKSWQKFSETLLMKFVIHGFTLHRIWSGLALTSSYYKKMAAVPYIDVESARAVLRSQMETFLMYHHIYVNPTEEDKKELRYHSWVYTGLLHRQQFPSRTEFAKVQRGKDVQEIARIKEIIINLPAYKILSEKQQAALIKDGSAKLFSHWNTIMTETGFVKNNSFLSFYTMLSVYAHSEGLSAIQLNAAVGDPSFRLQQSMIDCYQGMQLTCLMITAMAEMWPAAKRRFERLPEQLQWDVEMLSRLGKSTGEALEKQ